jgi:flavodoxin
MTSINCFVGTVYGAAEKLAHDLAEIAKTQSVKFNVLSPGSINDMTQSEALLIITSTTGQGDIPFELEALYLTLQSDFPLLTNIPFAVIALGDSSYGDTFCAAGNKFRALLLELQGKEITPILEVDAMETFAALDPAKPWFLNYITSLKKAV